MTRNGTGISMHHTFIIVPRTKSCRKSLSSVSTFHHTFYSPVREHQSATHTIICTAPEERTKKKQTKNYGGPTMTTEFRCKSRLIILPQRHLTIHLIIGVKCRPTAYPGKYNRLQPNTGQSTYHHYMCFFFRIFFSNRKTRRSLPQRSLPRQP